jgi:hypothetical protein
MHIAFTEANVNGEKDLISTVESSLVLLVRRDTEKPKEIHMVVSMPGKSTHFTAYAILDAPEEIARRVNAANSWKPGDMLPMRSELGFPAEES